MSSGWNYSILELSFIRWAKIFEEEEVVITAGIYVRGTCRELFFKNDFPA
jgi:hypothetical protein